MSDTSKSPPVFDLNCARCPRLASFLNDVKARYPDYHARPVPPFGPIDARLLVVGLAPGMHGANATGRPFTGDHAGILLYQTLYDFGFASHHESRSADDQLALLDCRISNAVKCLPPANKPQPAEVANCRDYLIADLAQLRPGGVVVALGRIAHEAVLRCYGLRLKAYPFAHQGHHRLTDAGVHLIDSYHCSRYNTQTKRLTDEMFRAVFADARKILDAADDC